MTRKKVFAVFLFFVAGFAILEARLYYLMMGSDYKEAAASQGTYATTVAVNRPNFYDRNGLPLTGSGARQYAIALPQDLSSYNILNYTTSMAEEEFRSRMEAELPFLVPLDSELPSTEPINTVWLMQRYNNETDVARHLIGYLDYEGVGLTGLEYVLEEYLSDNTTQTMMSVEVDALGRALAGADITFYDKGTSTAGVQLTVDREIQQYAEEIADEYFTRGAVVVLDTETFEIVAMVSKPNYDQTDVASAIQQGDGALVNRAVNGYNVGSVYKPLVAASALEAGVSPSFTYHCEGVIEVNGHSYSCNDERAHGEVDMQQALVHSCNTYFIALGQHIGSEAIHNTAIEMGLGKPVLLYGNYRTSAGNMPTIAQLNSYGELCNHCFGQGQLLASPIHVAAYTACIANGGLMRTPTLVLQVGEEELGLSDGYQVISSETASIVAQGMQETVEQGTGMQGQPTLTTAAGKTGTAQTGTYNDNGTERVMGWFTGWFPAENPRYVITVMTEDEGYGYQSAAPVFRELADRIFAAGLAD